MEELRSTDILDKEIEAAAQKKADKILKNASDKCEEIKSQVAVRLEEAKKQKEEYYSEKLNFLKNNLEAALPLEKERFLADFYARESGKSISFYLKNLDEEKRLSLLEKRFENRLQELKDHIQNKNFRCGIYGIDFAKTKAMIEKKLTAVDAKIADATVISFETSLEEKTPFLEEHFGFILARDDDFIKFTVSADNILSDFIEKNSLEIAKTLFSGRLPQ